METNQIRPTKKQTELLGFIEQFINQNGYSPSYREIMHGLNYNSVATVALHVNNLIKRGHLRKREHSARSLEPVNAADRPQAIATNQVKPTEEKWLIDKVEYFFKQAEAVATPTQAQIDELFVLIGTLRIFGIEGAYQSFAARLNKLRSINAN